MNRKTTIYQPRREAWNTSFPHSPQKESSLPTPVKEKKHSVALGKDGKTDFIQDNHNIETTAMGLYSEELELNSKPSVSKWGFIAKERGGVDG